MTNTARDALIKAQVGHIDTVNAELERLQEENTDLKNDLQRIYERVNEALADQPDNYASVFAVEDIQEIISKWIYPPKVKE